MFLGRALAKGEKEIPSVPEAVVFHRYAVKKIIEAELDTNLEASPENETNYEDLKKEAKPMKGDLRAFSHCFC